MKGESTTISIAHRLSTIKQCDYIYVLDNGSLVEDGSFAELSAKGRSGRFNQLMEWQVNGIDAPRVSHSSQIGS